MKKEKKKKRAVTKESAIRSAIRRTFSRSPLVIEVMADARRKKPRYNKDGSLSVIPLVEYLCSECSIWVPSKMASVDHKEPVIDPQIGFVDWNTYIDRMYCPKENLRLLCLPCHQAKSNQERFEKNFRLELLELEKLKDDPQQLKKFLKRFTKKRLGKFPYPQDFLQKIGRTS